MGQERTSSVPMSFPRLKDKRVRVRYFKKFVYEANTSFVTFNFVQTKRLFIRARSRATSLSVLARKNPGGRQIKKKVEGEITEFFYPISRFMNVLIRCVNGLEHLTSCFQVENRFKPTFGSALEEFFMPSFYFANTSLLAKQLS